MKQMRSRFRLVSLLLVCAFLLTAALCTGTVLRTAGISLTSLTSLPVINRLASSPAPSESPAVSPESERTPAPSDPVSTVSPEPENDISPNPEYNVYGL